MCDELDLVFEEQLAMVHQVVELEGIDAIERLQFEAREGEVELREGDVRLLEDGVEVREVVIEDRDELFEEMEGVVEEAEEEHEERVPRVMQF